MKRSFVVSSILHAAFLVLVISPGFQSTRNRIVEVINVQLVAEEKKQKPRAEVKTVKPSEPEPQPEKKTEKPKMAYKAKTRTRKTKEEVKVRPKEAKPREPRPEEKTETAPSLSAAKSPEADKPQRPAGATSNVRVDDEDFRFAYYLEIIKERVSFNWSPPPVSGGGNLLCTVYFKVIRDGRISNVKVEQASGFDLFDKSALRAVNQSGPLPPLPTGFDGRWLGVHFEFQQTSG